MDLKRELRRLYSRLYGPYDYSSHVIALHDYRAIYMAVPKVANSSLKTAVWHLMPEDIQALPQTGRKQRTIYTVHREAMFKRRLRLYKHQVSDYPGYFVFAFVRNPWDRLLSCYKDKIGFGAIMEDGRYNDPKTRSLHLGRGFRKEMSFRDFVEAVVRTPDKKANRHFRSQHTFLTDGQGNLLPSYLGRFEDLHPDFAEVMERIGAPHVSLPHVRRSQDADYRSYYDTALRDAVARRYARDIELFGYEF
jgi:chondroitin 4-sulfotransferase 11